MGHVKSPSLALSAPFSCSQDGDALPAVEKSHFASYSRSDWVHARLARVSSFVQEWTPFTLVLTYFIFSTCLYAIFPDTLVSVFWFVYLATNFYIAGMTVMEAFLSIHPIRNARQAVENVQQNGWRFPTPDSELLVLDVVIVAYLPNEKDIIMDRALYALEKLVYPRDKIRINIVYNTPQPMLRLETQLWDLANGYSHLRVIKVSGSTSKADNLNYFFTLNTGADVIAIFDCDHYMHPYGPRWAIERHLQDRSIDVVQGRCIVFNAEDSWLSAMISVEFDKIYAVSHPGRAAMWGFGLFTGSNGYWKASMLRELRMDDKMLTEDIDSALRSFSRGAKTVHDLNVVSYELAPTTFSVLWKQRLRWAQGWTQASYRHVVMTWQRPECGGRRSFKTRFGLFSLLLVRELSYYLVTQYTCFVASIVIVNFPTSPFALLRLIFFPFPLSLWFFVISILCLVGTLVITNYAKSEFASRWMIVVFSIIYPFYLIFAAVLGLYGHARQLIRYSSWNPTAR